MNSNEATKVVVLAEKHSDFIRILLEQQLDMAINLYELAFIHGFKHGVNCNENKS